MKIVYLIIFSFLIYSNTWCQPFPWPISPINAVHPCKSAAKCLPANLIKVQASEWWDKVFTPEYKLRSIAELEEYIDKNGHLPDMQTDNEVLSEGVDVAQMNALLLKKVEELTLYIIALEKKINENN